MGFRELYQTRGETLVSPWIGGKTLRREARAWTIDGRLPPEHGWSTFALTARKATYEGPAEAVPELLQHVTRGYLAGDRFVPDHVRVDPDPSAIARHTERVSLIEPGLDRFARVRAGRTHEDGPLVYLGLELPLGPEDDVVSAFLDRLPTVDAVRGVPPALDAVFRMETWRRDHAAAMRAAMERKRLEDEQRQAFEERRREIAEQLGDGEGRRKVAQWDFEQAATAALAVGGATYLDHRPSANRGEMVVRFRYQKRRFECVCDAKSLRIIDAGICLVNHETGEKGDAYFTLESLPVVIDEADSKGVLVVFRRAD